MKSEQIREERRVQILQATCDCLQNKVYSELSIKEITDRAGIAYGLVHFYFENKNALLAETIRFVLSHIERLTVEMMEPYQNCEANSENFSAFFRNWQKLIVSEEYAYYCRIWYDLIAQNRLSGSAAYEDFDTYKQQVAQPVMRILNFGEESERIYHILSTYMEGMTIRIYLYDEDPASEMQKNEEMLQMLLTYLDKTK